MRALRFFREGPRPSKGRKNQNLWLTKTNKKGKQKKGVTKKKKSNNTKNINKMVYNVYTTEYT